MNGYADFRPRPSSGFHGESDFDGHLPTIHLSFVDISACFDHLEPGQVFDRFVRASNSFINGVLDGARRGAGEFDEFINVVFHAIVFTTAFRLCYAISRPLVIGGTPTGGREVKQCPGDAVNHFRRTGVETDRE